MRCLPKGVSVSLRSGVGGQGHLAAVAVDRRCSASRPALALTIRCMSVKLAIERPLMERTRSPGLKSGPLGGAAGLNHVDARGEDLAPVDIGDAGEDRDREQEIGDRARRDDRGALGERSCGGS